MSGLDPMKIYSFPITEPSRPQKIMWSAWETVGMAIYNAKALSKIDPFALPRDNTEGNSWA